MREDEPQPAPPIHEPVVEKPRPQPPVTRQTPRASTSRNVDKKAADQVTAELLRKARQMRDAAPAVAPSRPPTRARPLDNPAQNPLPSESRLENGVFLVGMEELDAPLETRVWSSPPLSYEAREAGVTGRVFVQVLVGSDGSVRDTKVMVDPGYGLGEAAAEHLMGWRYSPPLRRGEPVQVWKTEVVVFDPAR